MIPKAEIEQIKRDVVGASSAPSGTIAGGSTLDEAAAHYHRTLLATTDILAKLRWRGTSVSEVVSHFFLGYADGTLERALAPSSSAVDEARRDQLHGLGLVLRNGREVFRGSLIIPIRDAAHRVTQLCAAFQLVNGRNTPHRYLPRLTPGLFHPEGLRHGPELIIAPSPLDAIRFWYAGYPNVTCTQFDLTLTAEHFALIRAAEIKQVLIAFEIGAESDRAALALAEQLMRDGIHAYRLELAVRPKSTSKKWGLMIRNVVPMLGAPPRPELPQLGPDWRRTTCSPEGGTR